MHSTNDTTGIIRHCAHEDLPPLPPGEEWLSEYDPTRGEWGWVSTVDFAQESLSDLRRLLDRCGVSQ